jgi:diadenosine tetraphosphatase ApaH/serine/threonine PP2A family protein phosphatase
MIVNPGSVGCPAYRNPRTPAHAFESGTPHARYVLIELEGERITVDFVCVPYDWDGAARRAEANGHPDWIVPLTTGTMG